jgi:hypothetical protein
MDATIEQRMQLYDLYTELGWDRTLIRNMTLEEAKAAIKKAEAFPYED